MEHPILLHQNSKFTKMKALVKLFIQEDTFYSTRLHIKLSGICLVTCWNTNTVKHQKIYMQKIAVNTLRILHCVGPIQGGVCLLI